ncbi:hypothetical protein ACFE33_03030 [Falsihalocynthiibacter sp. SS001]|uniref:hypothetical protein n=1 Tax=Falsihalocynthiibacter sp. SS001 TaxID=3349698 RepID=UPI0036D3BF13
MNNLLTKISALLTATLLAALPASANAQTLSFDQEQLLNACSASPGSCAAAVQLVIADLKAAGLSEAEFNSQLGVIAGTIVTAAQETSSQDYSGLGEALEQVAQETSDQHQAQSIRSVVAAVGSGNLASVGLDRSRAGAAAFAASPS